MKFLVLAIVVLAANAALLDEFELFKIKFNKHYATVEEEAYRRGIFENNLQTINAHNIKFYNRETTFKLGINQFADKLFEEISFGNFGNSIADIAGNYEAYSYDPNDDLPDSVDWRTKGIVTEVKDQGKCGSCWAFGTVAAVESFHANQTKELVELSEQNLVDCASNKYDAHGCGGAETLVGPMNFVKDNKGIAKEEDYKYVSGDTGKVTACTQKDKPRVNITLENIQQITNGDEQALKHAVATKGPVVIGMEFSLIAQFYQFGVLHDILCTTGQINHALSIVGYGSEKDIFGTDQEYWLIKNSYGKQYGEDGYLKLARNQNNMCRVASMVVIPA